MYLYIKTRGKKIGHFSIDNKSKTIHWIPDFKFFAGSFMSWETFSKFSTSLLLGACDGPRGRAHAPILKIFRIWAPIPCPSKYPKRLPCARSKISRAPPYRTINRPLLNNKDVDCFPFLKTIEKKHLSKKEQLFLRMFVILYKSLEQINFSVRKKVCISLVVFSQRNWTFLNFN